MDILGIDYESFSEIDLRACGAAVYARDPSTEVLMAAYQFNDGPIQQWVPAEGEPMPADLEEALISPDVQKWAWNAAFEMQITHQKLAEVDVTQWRCTMVQAMHCSLPGKLEKAGPVVGLDDDHLKDSRGMSYIRKFSKPRKPSKNNPSIRVLPGDDPAEWEGYKEYNRQDVKTESAIRRRLKPYMMPQEEWELYFLDQKINEAGLPINLRMVENAIRVYHDALQDGLAQMRALTGLANPNSGPQLLPWLQSQGYPFEDMKKGNIKTAVDYFKERPEHWDKDRWTGYRRNKALKETLLLRQQTSRTSPKKYHALKRATNDDGLLRHVLQMNGAQRTGRYAGRIYQPQNLPRPEKRFEKFQETLADSLTELDYEGIKLVYGNPFDVLASCLRPTMQAPPGMIFADADLNAIENRVLGWLAQCEKILNVFKLGRDPYIDFATYLYGVDYDTLFHEYKVLGKGDKRTIAKPGTLGCGYGMGAGEKRVNRQTGEIEATGLLGYAWGMGVKQFTPDDSKHSVDTFRREFKEVVNYWYDLERAAKKCITSDKPTKHGVVGFERQGPFLKMILPSKRPLYYVRPRIEERPTPWGDKKATITYEGLNDRKQWVRLHTTPGKITENADQAISRDLLVHGIKLANRRGLDVRLHVHDQVIALVAERSAEDKLHILKECMEEQPKWAEGLPLGAAGHTTRVFIKD